MNKVFINGNLTKDMDVKVLPNGNYVGKFTIANTVGYGDKKKTYFIPCTLFGKRVESLEKILVTGAGVLVEGQLDYTSVKDEQGNWKNYTNVVVTEIEITKFKQTNNYDNMSLEELREECKNQNIKFSFKDSAGMLIKKLNA
jgi:single-strand DNA-binding protein|nr:MAG TPA: Single strand binding protein [Caudoviricetes sp.]